MTANNAENVKPTIKVTPSQKYYDYMGTMVMLYGDAFVEWCKTEGYKEFDKWAEAKGYDFVKLTKESSDEH